MTNDRELGQKLNITLDRVLAYERKEGETFLNYYKRLYNSFKDELKDISGDDIDKKKLDRIHCKVKNYIRKVLKGESIDQSINQWWFNYGTQTGILESYARTYILPETEKWYRIRKEPQNFIQHPKDMFHVPFEKRGILSNCRYSLSGYPCLYCGRTILTCWEELRRPHLSDVYFCSMKANMSLRLLDLRVFVNSNISIEEIKKHIYMLPIILACSIEVPKDNEQHRFKSEYIIPQILLRTIIQNKKNNFHGIIYTSTVRSKAFNYDNSCYDNIAIPTKNISDCGYCKTLCEMFKLSKPVSYEYLLIRNKLRMKGGGNSAGYRESLMYQIERAIGESTETIAP